jgi:hypothetical protein
MENKVIADKDGIKAKHFRLLGAFNQFVFCAMGAEVGK